MACPVRFDLPKAESVQLVRCGIKVSGGVRETYYHPRVCAVLGCPGLEARPRSGHPSVDDHQGPHTVRADTLNEGGEHTRCSPPFKLYRRTRYPLAGFGWAIFATFSSYLNGL
jgi:hypothetical protein